MTELKPGALPAGMIRRPVAAIAIRRIIAAIDIGTENSGCAFVWAGNPQMFMSGLPNQPETAKVKTAFTLDAQGKLLDFGGDAIDKYVAAASELDSKTSKKRLYELFKMQLFSNGVKLETKPNVVARGGAFHISIVDAFGYSFAYFKDQLMKILAGQCGKTGIADIRITWVITVPAIWSDSAKSIMMDAARKGGLLDRGNSLLIALEPECASLYVRKTVAASEQGEMKKGTQYLVVDAGGGTIDLAFHEVQDDNTLKTISIPSGGNWGATEVNKRFELMLGRVFGQAIYAYERDRTQDYSEALRDFENIKRQIGKAEDEKSDEKLQIQLQDFNAFCEENGFAAPKEMVDELGGPYELQWHAPRNRLILPWATVRAWFNEDIRRIVSHIRSVLTNTKHSAKAIWLVGGYAECNLLFKAVEKAFPAYSVARPGKPGIGIVAGAVMYGLNPPAIATRISPNCYGIRCRERKTKEQNIFSVFLKYNESYGFDHTVEHTFYRPGPDTESVVIPIFAAKGYNPSHTTEPGCIKLGEFTVPMPLTAEQRKWPPEKRDNSPITVRFKFGTSITVTAKDETSGIQRSCDVDYFRS